MNEYTIRIYTGPCWIDQYIETYRDVFPYCHVWGGTEHVYLERFEANDPDEAIEEVSKKTGWHPADIAARIAKKGDDR